MADPAEIDIPAMIAEFMNCKLPNGRQMSNWLYIDLQDIQEATQEHHRHTGNECIEELGHTLHDEKLQNMKIGDDGLHTALKSILEEHASDDPSSAIRSLAGQSLEHLRQYEEAHAQQVLCKERLWPTIIKMQKGESVGERELAILDIVTGHHPLASELQLYTDEEWIPARSKISPKDSESVMDFFNHLRDVIKAQFSAKAAARGGASPVVQ